MSGNRVFQEPLKLFGEEIEYLDIMGKLNALYANAKLNEVKMSIFENNHEAISSLRLLKQSPKGNAIIERYSKDNVKQEIMKIQGIMDERKDYTSDAADVYVLAPTPVVADITFTKK